LEYKKRAVGAIFINGAIKKKNLRAGQIIVPEVLLL
jgi:hypothetical protein